MEEALLERRALKGMAGDMKTSGPTRTSSASIPKWFGVWVELSNLNVQGFVSEVT